MDDEADARDLVKRILEERNASVALAASGHEALNLLKHGSYQVLLCDISMPDMDGNEFIRRVRQRGDSTPAVALTALARSEDRTRALLAGYQGHIAKPLEPAELVATVAAFAKASTLGESG